jgi:hypothetical protein
MERIPGFYQYIFGLPHEKMVSLDLFEQDYDIVEIHHPVSIEIKERDWFIPGDPFEIFEQYCKIIEIEHTIPVQVLVEPIPVRIRG